MSYFAPSYGRRHSISVLGSGSIDSVSDYHLNQRDEYYARRAIELELKRALIENNTVHALARAEEEHYYYRLLAYERARERQLRYQQGLITSTALSTSLVPGYGYDSALSFGGGYGGGLSGPFRNYRGYGPSFVGGSSMYPYY